MKKIIYLAPHLSTGGLPQYLFRKMELLKDKLDIWCVEYHDITGGQLVVQKNRIKSLLPSDRFITLGEDKLQLIKIINEVQPDYIHLEEIPEDGGWGWNSRFLDLIYNPTRKYKIFETSHDSSFDPDNRKIYLPDGFFFVSQWQIDQYKNINVPKYLAEYPIVYNERPDRNKSLIDLGLDPNKKHVLNVGLFTPRKNQGEIFEIARHFGEDVQFHFLGNQAGNFESYWKPLMENKPNNCVWWGERNDADKFYQCMDLFLFTSEGNPGNKETMPLVLREALGWSIPILMYNLDVYQNYFNKYPGITYLEKGKNVELVKNLLNVNEKNIISETIKEDNSVLNYFSTTYNRNENRLYFKIIKNHPTLKKFSYRVRDYKTGLTFQPMGVDQEFIAGLNWWIIPNAAKDDHNGLIFEVTDSEGNIIESHGHESSGMVKHSWDPLRYPTTELYIAGKKIDFHSDPKDHSSFWSYYECILRRDYKGIQSGDIVVDVGANLGFFSLMALKEGASKSYAIEPFPTTYEYLCKNVEGLPVTTINCGIGNEDRNVDFVGGEVSSISRSIDYENNEEYAFWGDKKITTVRMKPFSQIIKENGIEFIDYLKIDCEGGEVELFNTIDPEFLKYRVKKISGEIHMFITGQDGYEKIKNQIIEAGFEYRDEFNPEKTLAIFSAIRKPKIRLVHILNNVDGNREIESINSLRELSKYGIEYVQHITPLYTDMPPVDNCNRPTQVSLTPGDYLLSPGHYGCYLGHRSAVCDFDEGVDGVLVSECDTILQVPPKEMAEKIIDTYFLNIKHNLILTSFGKSLPGYPHEEIEGDLLQSRKIVEAHLYLISKPYIGQLRGIFYNSKWDVSDLWYDVFVSSYRRGIYRKPYALQAKGVSYLDQTYKDGHIIHDHNVIYDPNRIDDDITVIIQSCDKYQNFWEGCYLSWEKNWNWDLKWPVIFCNEEIDLPFNDPRIQQIKSPKSEDSKGFSDRLIDILDKVKTKYVLYIQDDMWLTSKVNYETFKQALYQMRYNDWNCLRIHEKIWLNYNLQKTGHFINGQRVLKVDSTSEWLLTHNGAIWNKDFLRESMLPGEDPWKNEIDGTVRICRKYTDPKIYHLNEGWYYQPGASSDGKINPYMDQYQSYLKMGKELKNKFDL